jgi:hypothetical protein
MAINETIQRLFTEIGTPGLSMDPTSGIKINRFPEEVLIAQAQTSAPQANQPGYGYQIGQSVGGPEFNMAPPSQQSQQIPVVNNESPQPERGDDRTPPREKPEVTDIPRQSKVDEELSKVLEDFRTGKIDEIALRNRLDYLKVLQQQELQIEGMRAKTALEKKQIDENIAKYQANALREAEVAKALTLVAYKASRPDSELVSTFMSPMSGLSSLYKAVGPVSGPKIQTGGFK